MPPREWTDKQLIEAVASSRCIADVCRALGLRAAGSNHRTMKRHIARLGLSTEHFDPAAVVRESLRAHRHAPRPLEEVLVAGRATNGPRLKQRLYAAGLKRPVCELCGQGDEWHGKPLTLILDHVNGIHDDNRLENLRIVCPNCNSTLETHCAKGYRIPERDCEVCGKRFRPRGRGQRHCSRYCGTRHKRTPAERLAARKVERPPYDQLLRELEETSFSAVGRKYGVSDNAVRKWVAAYQREARGEAA